MVVLLMIYIVVIHYVVIHCVVIYCVVIHCIVVIYCVFIHCVAVFNVDFLLSFHFHTAAEVYILLLILLVVGDHQGLRLYCQLGLFLLVLLVGFVDFGLLGALHSDHFGLGWWLLLGGYSGWWRRRGFWD